MLNIPKIDDLNADIYRESQAHLASLTKPEGSLGRLEKVAAWYAAAKGVFPPPAPYKAAMLVFAADHGVAKEGVSAYPQSVTAAMVANMIAGGAAINALCTRFGIALHLYDVGVAEAIEVEEASHNVSFHDRKISQASGNILKENAMSRRQAEEAIQIGIEAAKRAIDQGALILGIGEMGIGNTTPAASLTAAFTGAKPEAVVGRGTGIDDERLKAKREIVGKILERLPVDMNDPIDVLGAIGGYEFAAMVGVMLEGASKQVPIVLDGFLTNAAALAALAIAPPVRHYLLASHRSVEPGADVALTRLEQAPLFDLGFRLGEGTGATLGIDFVRTAIDVQFKMATFDSAKIDGPA